MKMVIGKKLAGQEIEKISESEFTDSGVKNELPLQMAELKNRRGRRSKIFSDGSQKMKAEFYGNPVHFFDEDKGEYKEIDNRFDDNGEVLETRKNTFKSKFHKHLQNGKVFEMEKDLCSIGLKSLDAARCGVCHMEVCECAEGVCDCNKVLVKDVAENTDIEYVVDSERIKENIIVKERAEKYEYDFDLSLDNLAVGVSSDGKSLELTKKDTGKLEFFIPAPVMFDAKGESSEEVYYEIEQDALESLKIKVIANADWINADGRAFPVTIDPQVVAATFKGAYSYYSTDYNDSVFRYRTLQDGKVVGYELRAFLEDDFKKALTSEIIISKNKLPRQAIDSKNLIKATLKLKIKPGSEMNHFCINEGLFFSYEDHSNISVDITSALLEKGNEVIITFAPYFYRVIYPCDIRLEAPVLELSYNNYIESLSIVKPPYKTEYRAGEEFSADGMQVNAIYENGAVTPITNYHIEPEGSLATYDKFVTIVHNDEDVSVNCAIKVVDSSSGIESGLEDYYELYNLDESGNKRQNGLGLDYETILFGEVDYSGILNSKGLSANEVESCEIVLIGKTISHHENYDVYSLETGELIYTGNSIPDSIMKYPIDIKRIYDTTGSANFKLVVDTEFGSESFFTNKTSIILKTVLKSIKLTVPPDKLIYFDGEKFDKTGMKITATYLDGSTEILNNDDIIPSIQTELTTGKHNISLMYKSLSINLPIVVLANYSKLIPSFTNSSKNYALINGSRSYKNFNLPNDVSINYHIINKTLACLFSDIDSSNTYLGFNISHVYKPGARNVGYGEGFSLNVCERLIIVDSQQYYVDGLGDWYKIEDNNAKNMVYTTVAPAFLNNVKYYTDYRDKITDDNDGKFLPDSWLIDENYVRGFNRMGDLVMIFDYCGNFYEIKYSSTPRIKEINYKDSYGVYQFVKFSYDWTGKLTRMESSSKVISFTYTGNYLTTITNNGVVQTLSYRNGILSSIVSSDNYNSKIELNKNADIVISTQSFTTEIPGGDTCFMPEIAKWQISVGDITQIKDLNGNCEIYEVDNDGYVSGYYQEVNSLVSNAEKYEIKYSPKLTVDVYIARKEDLFKVPYTSFGFEKKEFTGYYSTTYNDKNRPETETGKNICIDDNVYSEYKKTYMYKPGTFMNIQQETEYTVTDFVNSVKYFRNQVVDFYYDAETNRLIKKSSYFINDLETEGKNIEEYYYNENGQVTKTISYNSLDPENAFITEKTYSEYGRLQSERNDAQIASIKYAYNNQETIPYSVVNPYGYTRQQNSDIRNRATEIHFLKFPEFISDNVSIEYDSDEITRLAVGDNTIEYAYDGERRLSKITVDGKIYQKITYDTRDEYGKFKDESSVAVRNAVGEMFTVKEDLKCTYRKVYYGITLESESAYNVYGEMVSFKDYKTDLVNSYVYNAAGGLSEYKCTKEGAEVHSERIKYNKFGGVSEIIQSGVTDINYKYEYSGAMADNLKLITISNNTVISPHTDKLKRYTGRTVKRNGKTILSEEIAYKGVNYNIKSGDAIRTFARATNLPTSFAYATNSATVKNVTNYSYDVGGNITQISDTNGNKINYSYDGGSRLIREDNKPLNKSFVYTYDLNGNISSKKEYAYNNITLPVASLEYNYSGGKLVQINDEGIIKYDSVGNPTQYRGKNLGWKGRQLTSCNRTTKFAYDGLGRRVKKGDIQFYYDSSDRLIKSSDGMEYFYDHTGVAGFKYSGITYSYIKDVQGNITAILDSDGNTVVKYTYDAWGNHTVTGTKANTVGKINPFRYRSYFYDVETKFYYLKTRYYDPEIGRFINIDNIYYADPEALNGLNLYAYCGNNPVMGYDPDGTWDWGKVRDIFSTIIGLLNPLSKYTAVGSIIVAACQGRVQDIKDDWNNGCFNPFNQDESVALSSKVFSFYKGESVIRHSISGASSCQIFGNIFLESGANNDTLNHEFGHGIQEKLMGPINYIFKIAVPSVITYFSSVVNYDYYSMPWERTADALGGVSRGCGYKSNSIEWALAENIIGPLSIPFYFMFGY